MRRRLGGNESRDTRADLLVAIAAAAFALGVLIWSAGFLWLGSSLGDAIDGFSIGTDENLAPADGVVALDCDAFGPEETPSPEEEAFYEENCASPTPAPPTATATPIPPTPTPTLAPTDANRFNCDRIRGTDYRSPDERTWFLDNCLTPTP